MTELLQEKYSALAGTTNNVLYTTTFLLLTVYYRYISRDSYYVFTICLGLNVVAFIGSLFLPESPKWLVSTEQTKRAKEELDYIARFNKIKPLIITGLKVEEEDNSKSVDEVVKEKEYL